MQRKNIKWNSVLDLLETKQYNLEYPRCVKEINYAFVYDLMSDALMLLKQMPSDIGIHGALVTGLAIESIEEAIMD